jgi:hypothetical protein
MTVQEMHIALDILFDKEATLNYPNFKPEHKDFFLNLAQDHFVKQRYSGNNAKNKGFEETQKRTDDLKNVTEQAIIVPQATQASNKPNGRYVDLPLVSPNNIYWFAITEEADITRKCCANKIIPSGEIKDAQLYLVFGNNITYNNIVYTPGSQFTGTTTVINNQVVTVDTYTGTGRVYEAVRERIEVKPMQTDDYNKLIKDPFNRPRVNASGYNQLRRLEFQSKIEVILPEDELIFNTYIIRYIRKPLRISLSLPTDCELADHTHQEIVEMAASSMLENIGSSRYATNLNEITKLE